jgi:hypothetical protein
MRTKKKAHGPSRFTRGVKASTKSARRHARKQAAKGPSREELIDKLDILTPL